MIKKPLLSICIPTWNRSQYLEKSLCSFQAQLETLELSEIEIYVSDNDSDDDTADVVNRFIAMGLPITYYKQDKNIGASRNFLSCMKWASGKYIYLLGDDDLLIPGALKYLLDKLRNQDYGLVHIHEFKDVTSDIVEFDNNQDFLQKVSFWLTFMSGSVFRRDIVESIDSDKFLNTHLLQVPYYIASAVSKNINLLISKNLLVEGLDGSSNGGYNFFEVFVTNYLSIWNVFVRNKQISKKCYNAIKKDILCNYLDQLAYNLLVRKRNVAIKNNSKGRKGWFIDGGWSILLSSYWMKPYFYKVMVKWAGRYLLKR